MKCTQCFSLLVYIREKRLFGLTFFFLFFCCRSSSCHWGKWCIEILPVWNPVANIRLWFPLLTLHSLSVVLCLCCLTASWPGIINVIGYASYWSTWAFCSSTPGSNLLWSLSYCQLVSYFWTAPVGLHHHLRCCFSLSCLASSVQPFVVLNSRLSSRHCTSRTDVALW